MTGGDHEAVYAAERVAFDGTDLEEPITLEQATRKVAAILDGSWWPGPPVRVVASRRDARSSSTRCAGIDSVCGVEVAEIRLAAGQLTVATAAHELAHALAGAAAGHASTYRSAYLDVVAVITNLDSRDRRRELHVSQLSAAFEQAGLAVGERRWPPPPASIWGPIVL